MLQSDCSTPTASGIPGGVFCFKRLAVQRARPRRLSLADESPRPCERKATVPLTGSGPFRLGACAPTPPAPSERANLLLLEVLPGTRCPPRVLGSAVRMSQRAYAGPTYQQHSRAPSGGIRSAGLSPAYPHTTACDYSRWWAMKKLADPGAARRSGHARLQEGR